MSRALRLIEDGALDEGDVEALAARLGVGDRHLRRLFQEQVGVSPASIAKTRRVHFAKQLIEDTTLPMSSVAATSGYRTIRRFNAAVRKTFDRTPSEIRARTTRAGERRSHGDVAVHVAYRAPFEWNAMLRWLAPRAIPGVEEVEGVAYRRTVHSGGVCGIIQIEPASRNAAALVLSVPGALAMQLAPLVRQVRRLFDLDADAQSITEQLACDPLLAAAAHRCPGVRVPGCWSRLEVAARIIVGQQVSIGAATGIIGRIAQTYGRALADPTVSLTHVFPTASALADADIAGLGLMPGARANTIRALAQAVVEGDEILSPAPDLDTAVARLRAMRGIGDWTAQCICMRALAEPDAFPAGDLWIRKALAQERMPTEAVARRRAEGWRPWRAYAAMLLWNAASQEEN